MTLIEQVKILDDKIKTNKAQYDLDKQLKYLHYQVAKNRKIEYLTVEDLGYKPDVIQKAKFEYSPLGKGLDESDKKEGVLKRLKNIEGKNKDQLDAIKEQGEKQLAAIKDQGKKQLDAIEKQKENKPKITEKGKIVYLKDKINKLFEVYPKSFTSQGKKLLRILAKNEDKMNYKNLSYKVLFPDPTFHMINF